MKNTRLRIGSTWPLLMLVGLNSPCFGQDGSIASKPDGSPFHRDATNGFVGSSFFAGNQSSGRSLVESNGSADRVNSDVARQSINRTGAGIPVPHDLRGSRVHLVQAILLALMFLPVAIILFEVAKRKSGEK